MPKKLKHIIQQQILDIHLSSEEGHGQLSSTISKLAQKELAEILEAVLNQYDIPHQTIRIDRLELDLGKLTARDLEQKLPYLFRRELEKSLQNIVGKLQNGQPSPKAQLIPQSEGKMSLLEHFLKIGSLPWWADETDLDGLFQELMKANPIAVRELIYKVAAQSSIRKRIVEQFSDNTIYQLFGILTPQQAHFFRDYVTDLTLIQEQKKVVSSETRAFKKVVQALALKYLVEHQSNVNTQAFFEGNLQDLSVQYQIDLAAIVQQFQQSIGQLGHLMKGKQPISKMVNVLAKKLEITPTTRNINTSGQVENLLFYLEKGYFPTSRGRKPTVQQLEKLLLQIIKGGISQNKLWALLQQPRIRQRLISQFSAEVVGNVLVQLPKRILELFFSSQILANNMEIGLRFWGTGFWNVYLKTDEKQVGRWARVAQILDTLDLDVVENQLINSLKTFIQQGVTTDLSFAKAWGQLKNLQNAQSEESIQRLAKKLIGQSQDWDLISGLATETDKVYQARSAYEAFLFYLSEGFFPNSQAPENLELFVRELFENAPISFLIKSLELLQDGQAFYRFTEQLPTELLTELLSAITEIDKKKWEVLWKSISERWQNQPEIKGQIMQDFLQELYKTERKTNLTALIRQVFMALPIDLGIVFQSLIPKVWEVDFPTISWAKNIKEATIWLTTHNWETIPEPILAIIREENSEWKWALVQLPNLIYPKLAITESKTLIGNALAEIFLTQKNISLSNQLRWKLFFELIFQQISFSGAELKAFSHAEIPKNLRQFVPKSATRKSIFSEQELLSYLLQMGEFPPSISPMRQAEWERILLNLINNQPDLADNIWKESPQGWVSFLLLYEKMSPSLQTKFSKWLWQSSFFSQSQQRKIRQVNAFKTWLFKSKIVSESEQKKVEFLLLPFLLQQKNTSQTLLFQAIWQVISSDLALPAQTVKQQLASLPKVLKPAISIQKTIRNWLQNSESPDDQTQEDALLFFLLTGKNPWWQPEATSKKLAQYFESGNEFPITVQKQFATDYTPLMGRRVYENLSSEGMENFLSNFFPHMAGFILSQALLLEQFYDAYLPNIRIRERERFIWQGIFNALFSSDWANFRQEQFIKSSVWQMLEMVSFPKQEALQKLRELAEKEIEKGEIRFFPIAEQLPQQPREVAQSAEEKIVSDKQTNTRSATLSEWNVLIYFFKKGALPLNQHISKSDFQALAIRQLANLSYTEKTILQTLLKQNKVQERISQQLGELAVWQVFRQISPSQIGQGKKLKADLGRLLPKFWKVPKSNIEQFFQQALLAHLGKYGAFKSELFIRELLELLGRKMALSKQIFQQKLVNTLKKESRNLKSDFSEVASDWANIQDNTEEVKPIEDAIYIANAGLVLLNPYFGRLFKKFEMLEGKEFVSDEAAAKAVHMMQFMITGKLDTPEPDLALNKLLCGIPLGVPIPKEMELTEEEQNMCISLLKGVIANWPKMSGTSLESFRETFLIRDARLTELDEYWQLTVETKAYDLLIGSLPWRISTIRLPWMRKPVFVDWEV